MGYNATGREARESMRPKGAFGIWTQEKVPGNRNIPLTPIYRGSKGEIVRAERPLSPTGFAIGIRRKSARAAAAMLQRGKPSVVQGKWTQVSMRHLWCRQRAVRSDIRVLPHR